ncbi:MAG: ADP-ribosylation factor-directed GTPase activating protein isoform b [Pirellulales bacterium]
MARILPRLMLAFAIFLPTGCRERPLPDSPIPLPAAATELPSDQQLKQMIDRALNHTFTQRHLDVGRHAAWQILHGALPFGMRFQVYAGDEQTGAIQWVLDGKPMIGWMLEDGTRDLPGGRRGLRVVLDPGDKKGQGHYDQWLAIMTQCGLKLDQPIKFQGRTYQLLDILQQAQWDLEEGKECSWTLIALSHYLDINDRWSAGDGQTWTIEKIVQMEADQNLNDSACGGTHRLIGMAMALEKYRQSNDDLSGGWIAADHRIQNAIQMARAFQQQDGTFSTDYLASNRTVPGVALRLDTTGHTLEFLALALDPHELAQPWVIRSVVALCSLFERAESIDLDCGPLYHATHGLLEYRERRFGPWEYPG